MIFLRIAISMNFIFQVECDHNWFFFLDICVRKASQDYIFLCSYIFKLFSCDCGRLCAIATIKDANCGSFFFVLNFEAFCIPNF